MNIPGHGTKNTYSILVNTDITWGEKSLQNKEEELAQNGSEFELVLIFSFVLG